jgi:hypothetical protein
MAGTRKKPEDNVMKLRQGEVLLGRARVMDVMRDPMEAAR